MDYTVSYYLTQADAETANAAIASPYQNITNPQTIYVRVDNNTTTCFDTAMVTLQVNPLPIVELEDAYLLCINTNGSEVINQPIIDTGLDATLYTFEWLLNGNSIASETGAAITPTAGGTYTVVVTNSMTLCNASASTIVNVSEPPALSAEILTPAFSEQNDILVTVTNPGVNSDYEFSIDGGTWETGDTNTSITFADVSVGEHTITVRDVLGCGESSITIMAIDYPLYFTPNNDGYNDTWNIIGLQNQPDAKIYVFDRFGKLLKQLSPTGNGWDGTFNGNPMPATDYWFTLEYREPLDNTTKNFRAHFSLKR